MKIHSLTQIPSVSSYLKRIGAEERSLRTAVVREMHGSYWRDLAVINLQKSPDGQSWQINAPEAYAPTEQEAQMIQLECMSVQWPELKRVPKAINLPDEIKKAPAENVFEFRDEHGNLIMLQVRIDIKGEKRYVPWTFWDDDQWRRMEPEGKLPLWGIDQLSDHTTVFIHEGAKAARHVAWMVKGETPEARQALSDHPWGEELSGAAHVGWIGGALSPYRTDWSILKKMGVKRVYIVSDNDVPGVAAVPSISYHIKLPTFHIQFTNEWPASFDLADPFPKKMFDYVDGIRYYIGPSFKSCLHPATWATDLVPPPKGSRGKPTPVLRENFKDLWAYVEEADMFVCVEMPEIMRSEAIMNKMLAGFSHVNNTSTLMVRAYRGRSTKLCYRPDVKGRIVTDKTTSAINLHTPTQIKSTPGDPKPFLDYLKYMFPVEHERKEVERWCATLIARPENRMLYALLLVSKSTGIGKTTLGERILAPLVGIQNTGFPSEEDITKSGFNGWIANKRLVVVGEIYSGHSWRAYNSLKGKITDKSIEVNEKYQRPYLIENWVHIIACSNSRSPLKMEDDDRRWFYPKVTEVRWPAAKFAALFNWLQGGGLGIIRHWAENYGDYVDHGARAPMTELKKELIAASRSKAQQEVADLAQAACDFAKNEGTGVVFTMKEIEAWSRVQVQEKIYDTDLELRNAMEESGMVTWEKRIKIDARLQYVVLTKDLFEECRGLEEAEANSILRKHKKKPTEIIGESM